MTSESLQGVNSPALVSEEQGGDGSQRSFTLEDVFNSSLKPKSYSLSWISDHEYLHKSQGSVLLHDVVKEQSTEFLSRETFVNAYDYHLSADRRYVAFVSNHSKIWRHSFTASYSLFDRDKFLTPSDIPDEVQFFDWAPEGNKLAFVWKNDVYVKTRPGSPPQQVTFDGEENQILNGIPDWVYEEEMFSSNQGLWWSPGGKYVAYAQFNDTQVHAIEYPWYGENQYPSTVSIPYPKPGTPNPVVKLFVVDTDNTTKITEVVVPASFGSSEHYLATVTWVTDNRIAVQWLKRVQNHLILQIYSFTGSSWDPAEVKHRNYGLSTRTQIMSGAIKPLKKAHFTASEAKVKVYRPVFSRPPCSYAANGLQNDLFTIGTATPITSGEWEVIDILKVTADRVKECLRVRVLLYLLTEYFGCESISSDLHCVFVRWTKDGTKCLTCSIHKEKCQYNSAYFSHNASFYRMSCSGQFNFPPRALAINNCLHIYMIKIMLILNLGGYKLWFQMFLPPGFDESKKYPLLIDVYAGPCSQKADFVYRVSWSTYLASTENIIVASFDGRGSGFQGDKLMHEIYKRLGTYEVEDQITAAKEFIKFGFVDKDRVAIWGWSYGGYVTSMALGSGSGVFKCGMAVAPVSKWEYYDSIYTERYMMEPSENADNSTVTARAQNFHPVQYLLVHGTADDNVHFQQGAEISEALVEEQVDFEAMWYTDKDHGLGGSAYQHVYTHMSHFLQRCFA
uniref:Uncharacterized protein n=1 Tax=Scophthalmus maximus TaxID=52904 RepID=A0A8D2ZE76_SCOMX